MSAMPRFLPSCEAYPGLSWTRSTYSTGANNCVEVSPLPPGGLAVRDSKQPDGPALVFTPHAWADFLGAVRNGEF
ncbi:hypothetical protein SRB5_07930 [Streptomyces sp. RB5]|uniref:DUF397 domain-containing protein n=1 Tax=Streptomyces smaragdinus TaxID=2585196 RepID=A0A7K0CB53_9ACTN|nr:DUF397 domain-containing protein [Streptomyces smaragdinus]MQY10680.1 hypothetical protein [Streptomyces smaragdinus]